MLKYAILIGLFRVYLLGLFLFWVHAISVVLFGRKAIKSQRVIQACIIAFIWPVAIFSPEGRRKLFRNVTKL